MHNIFKELLPKSRGESKFVICANVDVRAFSNFSKQVESPESALFIKKAFIKITDNYFSDTSFFKSTGDGLIIVFDVIEEELEELSQKIIDTSIKLVKDFSSLLDDDPMINFDVPDKIGIGLSRGPATCILSDSTVLDYSGDTLNLASRLMDCARPEGVVFDSNFGYELLKPGQKKLFNNKAIYIKGISESVPADVWYTEDKTVIPSSYDKPIHSTEWEKIKKIEKFKIIKSLSSETVVELPSHPKDISKIDILITHSKIADGKVSKNYTSQYHITDFTYENRAGISELSINNDMIVELLTDTGVKDNMKITRIISYPKL